MKRKLLAIFLILGILAGSCPQGLAEKAGGKVITLMVYMCGSNLESSCGAATRDLIEMASSEYNTDKINLLVMTGGTKSWQMGFPADALCIYVPFRKTLRMVHAFENMSMGSPEALNALLAFGTEKYPADEYALIFWNHGGGPMNGICWDELYDSDHLTMEELCAALQASPFSKHKLAWIGFDACLMASAETAFLMSPFAEYMIASEETEPDGGWNYLFLKDLENDPDSVATARRIIDGYFETGDNRDEMTLSCIDLSRMEALSGSMDAFFENLDVSNGNYAWFSYAARSTHAFGKALTADSGYDLMDLNGLIDHLEDQAPDQAAALRSILEETVLYSRSSTGNGYGLSVYHPFFNKREYTEEWGSLYPRLGFSREYSSYIARFSGYLLGKTDNLDWEGLRTAYTEKPSLYALPLTGPQREMLSSVTMQILRWDAERNAYMLIGSQNRQQESDGVVFMENPRMILVAEDTDGTPLTGALPYEIRSDGSLSVYVNFCRGSAAESSEASAFPSGRNLPGRKEFGSYSFDDNQVQSTSMKQDSPDALQTGSDVPEETAALSSVELRREIEPVPALDVSPLSSTFLAETMAVPGTVSFSAVYPVASSAAVYPPAGFASVQIEPAQVYSVSMAAPDDVSVIRTGSEIPLDSFVSVEVSEFRPDQIEVDLSRFEPEALAEKQKEDLIHGQLILDMDEAGNLSIREIQLYEPLNGEWSARMTAQLSDYPVLSFPVSWKQPARVGNTLASFRQWQEISRQSYQIENKDLSLRFVADPENGNSTCVLFEVTDIQYSVHSSLPILANP